MAAAVLRPDRRAPGPGLQAAHSSLRSGTAAALLSPRPSIGPAPVSSPAVFPFLRGVEAPRAAQWRLSKGPWQRRPGVPTPGARSRRALRRRGRQQRDVTDEPAVPQLEGERAPRRE